MLTHTTSNFVLEKAKQKWFSAEARSEKFLFSCTWYTGELCVSGTVNNCLYGPSSCTSKNTYLYCIRALGFCGL